jgi:putative FmdB family regulatory protein
MPTYDYMCQECGTTKEVFHKINDEPEVTCPKCGKTKMKKLMSAPPVVFKGTGWYCKDNCNKK